MVGPMILTLLPVLIGYTGGRLVHGQRGAVIGAVATMGIIVGSEIPQFLGAMAIGPLAAWLLMKFDSFVVPRTKVGFEMLVNNFSLGILGVVMAIVGYLGIGPIVTS
jgi:mannitol PTS system EIICBA or EIICB component